ncbi:hypothetical protein EDF60_0313 [Leucobacter luti]|uniref:hypothetical protein n=1 Tax=Leucobacter luti TaxID=340320 RepID=UPI001051C843|nr:hypothetical protein [Leucobacter luti]MCW2288757.1 hypothetical protein [Leucobacter luti]TCK45091.1 hypothetical protein EDF60_0313 [Leucobacter luti]
MAAEPQLADALERAAAACRDAAATLQAYGVEPEHLAALIPPKRVLLWTRPARMAKLGSVWRLGTLLLGTDGALYAAGRATRAAERGRPGYQSVSREERKEIAAAALRGGYEPGSAVNFDATPLVFNADALADPTLPVGIADGEVRVRWRAGASLTGAATLAAFMSERAELLRAPIQE